MYKFLRKVPPKENRTKLTKYKEPAKQEEIKQPTGQSKYLKIK